ncbi:30S ribosomal protein S14 [Candidatus Micrarchaeota archaeon]|nr:30S ribosomal protein S14 [Candidatus Micrarchaeota archaeon]
MGKGKTVSYERKYKGKGEYRCRICGTTRSVITAHGLMICRRCFREVASKIGYRKY